MDRIRTLEMAAQIVRQDRQNDYGTPEDNFGRIARLWGAYLGTSVDQHDVAAMMALVKVARIATSPAKADNWIDLAGYAACGAEVAGAE